MCDEGWVEAVRLVALFCSSRSLLLGGSHGDHLSNGNSVIQWSSRDRGAINYRDLVDLRSVEDQVADVHLVARAKSFVAQKSLVAAIVGVFAVTLGAEFVDRAQVHRSADPRSSLVGGGFRIVVADLQRRFLSRLQRFRIGAGNEHADHEKRG